VERDRKLEGTAEPAPADDDSSYRLLVDGVEDCGLILLDPAGRILTWNTGSERLTGYGAAEIVGRPVAVLQASESAGGDELPRELAAASADERSSEQVWRVRKDGSRFCAESTVTALRGPGGELRGFALVLRDLTESQRLESELHDQARRLADASRFKDDLLGLLGHDLRNPLAPIRNSLHVLRRGSADPRLAAELYEVMDRQVDRLTRIVEDVLEISRLSRGLIAPDPQHLDMHQVGHEAVERRRAEAERAGLTLTAVMPAAPVWVRADAGRLRRVVDVLLGNALKFTSRGGSIIVEVSPDGDRDRTVLVVRDSGIGIAPDVLERMHEALARPAGSLDRGQGGLGLGLALARGIIEMLGGTLRVESAGTGRGAAFTLALPLAQPAATPTATDPPPAASSGVAPALRVLVVEDNPDAAESLRRLLRLHGHEVSVAVNGVDGVAEAKRSHPDAVVCDIGLPGMDGYAVATALRGDPETARARLIAVTGYGRAEDRARALSSGFDEHIVKPADPELLLSKLAVTAGR
jgi:PAS domain S-box-containing protein